MKVPGKMRELCSSWPSWPTIIACGLLLASKVTVSETEIPKTLVEFWAKQISVDLLQLHRDTTGFHTINDTFNSLVSDGSFKIAERNGTTIVSEFAKSLKTLLDSKTEALQNIKAAAEKSEANYSYEEDISYFRYENIRTVEDDGVTLDLFPTFSDRIKVNTSKSFVQIPTNIYAYSKHIASVARWSEDLDEVFVSNFNTTPSLLWQYFGSLDGPFRTYPGKQWKVDDKGRDLYDCRRRSWFIAASSSPKAVVVMIDISGTMIGNNFAIAKIAAMSLIDTLQENDYFNVIHYNKDTGYAVKCLTYLIQATATNKEAMKLAVQSIPKPQYEDKIDGALEVAFNLLEGITSRNGSLAESDCNQVIAFFSDGVEGSYAGKEVFEKRNQDKKVRVFSFLVGRRKDSPMKAMREMSCNNRGHFYMIETIGNVWDTVLEYMHVLSRPVALSNSSAMIYTPLYLDASGLGMMMTAALPVTKNVTDPKKARLLGVAGTDIAMSTLEAQIPFWKLGVLGYGFAINNNGFLLFHPRLRKQYGYLPAPPNVFLDDVEILYKNKTRRAEEVFMKSMNISIPQGANELLKKHMIDRETGSISFKAFAVTSNDTRLTTHHRHFYYTPAAGTPFSVCIAIEDHHKRYHTPNLVAVQAIFDKGLAALKSKENSTQAVVANWPYCRFLAAAQGRQPYSKVIRPTAEEIRAHLDTNGARSPECDEEMIAGLLLSAYGIAKATDSVWDTERNEQNDVISVYAATSFGYSRYLNTIYAINGTREPAPFGRNVVQEEFYVHAAHLQEDSSPVLVFSVPGQEQDLAPFSAATISRRRSGVAVSISVPVSTNDKVLAAVVGMSLNSTSLNQRLLNATSVEDPSCNTPSCKLVNCNNNESYGCYLVDEGGFIVASSRGNRDVGAFLGMPQGPLVKQLRNSSAFGLFTWMTLNDSQFECPRELAQGSSAFRLLTPFVSIVNMVGWGIQTMTVLLSQVTLPSMLYGFEYARAQNVTPPPPEGFVSCTKEFPFYMTNFSMLPMEGVYDCGKSCRQHFAISKVPNTNLFFIVLDTPCQGACTNAVVRVTPYKVESESMCHKKVSYRRGLEGCKAGHPDESTECGAGSSLRAHPVYVIAFILLRYLASNIFD